MVSGQGGWFQLVFPQMGTEILPLSIKKTTVGLFLSNTKTVGSENMPEKLSCHLNS